MTYTPTRQQLDDLTRKQLQDIRLTGFEYSEYCRDFNFIFGDEKEDFNKIGLIHRVMFQQRG